MPTFAPDELQEGAIGAELVLVALDQSRNVVDISGATLLEMIVTRPDNTSFTRTAEFDTDGEDGAMKIITEAGDLTPAGIGWRAQGRVVLGSTTDVRTSIYHFEVLANL